LANPPPPPSPGGEALDPRRFPALPGAAAEAQALAQLWNARGGSSQVLTGPAASGAALKIRAPGQRVIHLATHGFFLAEKCQQAREALLAGNPLLRSGLVLADGFLTAEEVSALRLQGTELVVLSGCDTARGTAEAGEGLLGLRRAFHAAGARQVVSSLWPVDDQATQTWMTNFYQAKLEKGSSISQSVRAASLAELRARRQSTRSTHPFYWGGFLAAGH